MSRPGFLNKCPFVIQYTYIYFLIWSIIAGFSTTPKLFLVFTSTYLITYNPGYLPLGNNIHSYKS